VVRESAAPEGTVPLLAHTWATVLGPRALARGPGARDEFNPENAKNPLCLTGFLTRSKTGFCAYGSGKTGISD
jgi:hypothetical protein